MSRVDAVEQRVERRVVDLDVAQAPSAASSGEAEAIAWSSRLWKIRIPLPVGQTFGAPLRPRRGEARRYASWPSAHLGDPCKAGRASDLIADRRHERLHAGNAHGLERVDCNRDLIEAEAAPPPA